MKKPLAALIIAKMKDKKGPDMMESEDEMSSEDEGESEGYTAAAEEIISAIKDNDAESLAMALRSFVEQC